MNKCISTFLCFILTFSFASCSEGKRPLKIGVIADLHYLSEQLMDNGEATKAYEYMSGKAIREVPFVLDQVLTDYMNSDIDILLIPGDLTKDGEKISHIDLVKKLEPLMDKGVKVFVIPGNHDINMPNSSGYKENTSYSVENISPSDFVDIYADCGYTNALSRDTASLSYVAQLDSSTWLLAIDVSRYKEYKSNSISGGKLAVNTEKWISKITKEAKQKNIMLIGMMHHGLVEHIMMQSTFFPEYIVEDWQRIASLFADCGMKAIFTGHFHANDITEYESEAGNKIYDIETGSLAAYAFPYRFVELNDKGMKISTKNITATPLSPDLAQKNKAMMEKRAKRIAIEKINSKALHLPDTTLTLMSDIIAKIFVMHLKGDESVDLELRESIKQLSLELDSPIDTSSKLFGIDFYPADNNVRISF